MADNQIVPRGHNQIVPRGHNDPEEEKVEEEKPGMVVEETPDTEAHSQESAAEPEESGENPREGESVFGGRDFASSSFDQGGGGKKKLILIILVVLAGLGLIAGGVWVYNAKIKQTTVTPTPSPQIVPSPTPTPKVEVDVSAYKTRVLNGSGTPGKAGVIKDMLEKEGFKGVATSNAKSFDYKETEVSMKASVPPVVFEKIKKTLSDYTVVARDDLKDDSDYDITVIVGASE